MGYLPSRADGSKRAAYESVRCRQALASRRNATPRGGCRHPRRLRIRFVQYGIQFRRGVGMLQELEGRLAEVDGPGGDAGVVPRMDAEPGGRNHPWAVEYGPRRGGSVAARLLPPRCR